MPRRCVVRKRSRRQMSDYSNELDSAQALDAELLPLARETATACRRYAVRQEQYDLAAEYTRDDSDDRDEMHLGSDAELQSDLGLLERILIALAQRPRQLAELAAYCNYELMDWASECVFAAAKRSQLAMAIALSDAWDRLSPKEPAEQLGSKAQLLLCGGQPEAAKSAAQDRVLREPENLYALEVAADIFQDCGDLETAERFARSYVAVARQQGDATDLCCALYTLSDILSARGDTDAANALDAEADELLPNDPEDDLEDDLEDDNDIPWDGEDAHHCPHCSSPMHSQPATLPVVRSQPKIGRNQTCPCGSGVKYKKCCGR